jgi:hypothetical protein
VDYSNDTQNSAPDNNEHEDFMGPDDNAPKEYVLAGWNDKLFATDFLESLESNDGKGQSIQHQNKDLAPCLAITVMAICVVVIRLVHPS